MKNDSGKTKSAGKSGKDSKMEALQKKAPDLEPCDQPQAQEALRLHTADEACDDGVD